jgi:hypothetical protein
MKFAVLTWRGVWITDADTITQACDEFDGQYPGTILAVMQLKNDDPATCPWCGGKMEEKT